MTETVMHIVGHVGTDVDYRAVGGGTDLSTFRVAQTPRRWDRGQRTYVDGNTNWLSVQCWRTLAVHVRDSIHRGDPVVVVGKLRTDEWVKDGVKNSRLVLEAITVGHDLNRGTATFAKMARQPDPAVVDTREIHEAIEQVESGQPTSHRESDRPTPYRESERPHREGDQPTAYRQSDESTPYQDLSPDEPFAEAS